MDKSSGELVTLTPNNNNTVQPVALMRLGVFVPTLKSLKNSKKNTLSRTDATEELTRLSLARAEGFDKVEITGPRLDMDNDFKTWVGIIHSFARHNVIGDKVELPLLSLQNCVVYLQASHPAGCVSASALPEAHCRYRDFVFPYR